MEQTQTSTPKKVLIYSTPTCHYCHLLKDYLTEKGIAFESIDVSSDVEAKKAAFEKSGQMAVPVTDIEGNIVIGFDQDAVDELLGITS
jgi:glutaredoxin-like YruB-family protein